MKTFADQRQHDELRLDVSLAIRRLVSLTSLILPALRSSRMVMASRVEMQARSLTARLRVGVNTLRSPDDIAGHRRLLDEAEALEQEVFNALDADRL
jgi:hypothetical protein